MHGLAIGRALAAAALVAATAVACGDDGATTGPQATALPATGVVGSEPGGTSGPKPTGAADPNAAGTRPAESPPPDTVDPQGGTRAGPPTESRSRPTTALGVRGQPQAILFDRSGIGQMRWVGPFDEEEALEIARSL